MAHGAMGLAAAAHPQLAQQAARPHVRRRRPGRLHDRRRGRGADRPLRHGGHGSGPHPHDGAIAARRPRRGLRRRHGPGELVGRRRRDRVGRLQRRVGAGAAGGPPAGDHLTHGARIQEPRPGARGRRPGRRRLGERHPDRRRVAAARARGQPRRGGARPGAAPLPRGGHPLVDGGRGRPRRALRRDGRSRPGAQPALDAAGRLTGRRDPRPEHAHPARRTAARAARGRPRRAAAVLRLAAERLPARGPEAQPAPRHPRCLGRRHRLRRLRAARAVRPDRGPLASRCWNSIWDAARSRRSSGPPDTDPISRGWSSRCSTRAAA